MANSEKVAAVVEPWPKESYLVPWMPRAVRFLNAIGREFKIRQKLAIKTYLRVCVCVRRPLIARHTVMCVRRGCGKLWGSPFAEWFMRLYHLQLAEQTGATGLGDGNVACNIQHHTLTKDLVSPRPFACMPGPLVFRTLRCS
jgi:hypothetical protein